MPISKLTSVRVDDSSSESEAPTPKRVVDQKKVEKASKPKAKGKKSKKVGTRVSESISQLLTLINL
jgi:hypothetical protein